LRNLSLVGKTALVTGAGTGIGRAVAEDLASLGASIVIVIRSSVEAANDTAQRIRDAGGQATVVKANIRNTESCEKAAKAAVEEYGSLDVLVNNAGARSDALVMRMSETAWSDVIDTNFRGTLNMSRAAARFMVPAGHGKIINVTSVAGLIGSPGQANYSASKAAIIGLTRSLAIELAAHNIQVNAVAPGFVSTKLTSDLTREQLSRLLGGIPAGRAGQPDDISGVIAFLATPRADFITGQTFVVDGGMTA
jgi:3-oxoacyl-[acyl-carrier protein] reductase